MHRITALLAVALSAIAPGFMSGSANAAETDVQLLHSATGNTHCYRIIHDARKPLQEISLGSTWGGHPISDKLALSIVSKPAGWKAAKVVRNRHGYQFVLLTAPEIPRNVESFPTGNIGKACFRLSASIDGLEKLPFAYQLQGEPNRISAIAEPDDGHVLQALDGKSERAIEKVEKAKDAVEAIDKLKELF